MAAARSSGSAHSSPGHQGTPLAGSDSDHSEPTHPPTHAHPAHRWTTLLRSGCRRDARLISFIGAQFATAVQSHHINIKVNQNDFFFYGYKLVLYVHRKE